MSRRLSNHSDASQKAAESLTVVKKIEQSSSLLDRLTIIDVEISSSKKKKGRRKSIPRNDKPLPDELLLRHGLQDSVSMIPDCLSNTFSKEEEIDMNMIVNSHTPILFTFDIVPSLTEASTQKENIESVEGESKNTTDANIGDDDDISGIFDELDEQDTACVKDVEEKYRANYKKDTPSSNKNETNETNMESLDALSKLELISRTRTDSTAFLSEVSSNETNCQFDKPSKLGKSLKDEARCLVAHDDLQIKASRCISLNMFSMFN